MRILELRSTTSWKWVNPTTAAFSLGHELNYEVTFDKVSGAYHVVFTLGGSTEVSGTGRSPTVFAAVMGITKEFIERENPEALFFGADTDEKNRLPLYKRLLLILKRNGWLVGSKSVMGDSMIYWAKRPNSQINF